MFLRPYRPDLLLGICLLPALVLAAEPTDPLRLTRHVEPLAQAVELTVDPARDDYSGRTVTDVVARQPFTSFRVHALGPVIGTATLVDPAGREVPLAIAVTQEKLGLVTLTAPAEQPAGQYRVRLEFTARYQRNGLGLYKTVSRGDPYLFTQFEDKHARKAFPCWDEPSFKIPWQLTLRVPAALEGVSNSPLALESRDGDWKVLQFGRTPPMPTYLVALAVGPLEYVPVPGLAVPGRVITPRGQSALAAEAVRLSPPLLARLEEYFGIPMPYAKLDQIGAPEYVYGAMENVGLVTYTDRLLLLDPEKAPFSSRRLLANVIAHEFAHMWYGNLVTMAWWEDLWLNESFADWMCSRIVDQQYPEFRITIQQAKDIFNAMRTDALPSVTPIRRPVTAETELEQLADELTYDKGKGILNMVENWIGPDRFRAAMQLYFRRHAWGNAVAADLWAAFRDASGDDIPAILAGFIERPGVPLVSLEAGESGALRLTQRRFANLGDTPPPGRWQVPVVLAWSKAGVRQRTRVLLTEETQELTVPGLADADWIYLNDNQAGYYRWNLPPEWNARLARHAVRLAPIERVGLLDNAGALLASGQLTGADYLAYLAAFAHDEDADVNASVIAGLAAVRDRFVTPELLAAYNAYRAALLRPALDRIGLEPAVGEPAAFEPLRASLWRALGREGADPAVVAAARRLAGDFLRDPAAVNPALLSAALEVAAYHGNAAAFDALQAAVEKPQTPAVRSALIAALGSVHDEQLARRALDWSLTPTLNSTEFLRIAFSLGNDPDRQEQTVDWTIANYEPIAAKAPANYVAFLINIGEDAAPPVFDRLRGFLSDPNRASEHALVNIGKSTDRMTLNLRLRDKEQAGVAQFLRAFPGNLPKG